MAQTQRARAAMLLTVIGVAVVIGLPPSPGAPTARAAATATVQPATSSVRSDIASPRRLASSSAVSASSHSDGRQSRPHPLRTGLILVGSLVLMAGAVFAGCRALVWLMRRKLGL